MGYRYRYYFAGEVKRSLKAGLSYSKKSPGPCNWRERFCAKRHAGAFLHYAEIVGLNSGKLNIKNINASIAFNSLFKLYQLDGHSIVEDHGDPHALGR